jgi:hypothetical protein
MADGGNVEFVEIDGPVVYLRLAGACGSCPSSLTTMTMGIKRRLMERIPDIMDVEQVQEENKGLELTEANIDTVLDEIRWAGCGCGGVLGLRVGVKGSLSRTVLASRPALRRAGLAALDTQRAGVRPHGRLPAPATYGLLREGRRQPGPALGGGEGCSAASQPCTLCCCSLHRTHTAAGADPAAASPPAGRIWWVPAAAAWSWWSWMGPSPRWEGVWGGWGGSELAADPWPSAALGTPWAFRWLDVELPAVGTRHQAARRHPGR